jgi:FkbM family methyltransferase
VGGAHALSVLGAGARAARRAGLGGALRVGRDAADALFVRAGRPPLRATLDGVEVRGYLRHRSFLAHVSRGTYEPMLRRLFERALSEGATVVDAGAHVGLYTLLAARRVGPRGRVVAFEPDPYNAAALERNLRREGCANVSLVRKAVADAAGRVEFHQSLGTISSSFQARSGRGPFRTLVADLTTIDSCLRGLELDRLVVKLDVEGAEPLALEGLTATLGRANSAVLFVEANPPALAAAGSDPAKLFAKLRALGFEPALIDEDEEMLVPAGTTLTRPGNLYCARRG